MPTIITQEQIETLIKDVDVIAAIEEGFVSYSNGMAVVPPVGELLFENPKGVAHIKYGYIRNHEYYCVKIASGFYENPRLGIPSNQGLMLLFNRKTGQPQAVLLDNGLLTDIRTAAAGAIVAKYYAPKNVKAIGIIGTGVQAKLQLKYLHEVRPCKTVWLWGRTERNTKKLIRELSKEYDVHVAKSTAELAHHCNLIVTTTPSQEPLLFAQDIRSGTHITAVGSDTKEKQELDVNILKRADLVISDCIPQSKSRGEIFQAVSKGSISITKVLELGSVIQDSTLQRTTEEQITIADLTGVAVQDIMIATAVYTGNMVKNKKFK